MLVIVKASVSQVVSMYVPEVVLLHARALALTNVLLHVTKRVAQAVKDFVQ